MWIGLSSQSHLRFGFDSDSRPSSSALPLQAPTGEGKGAVDIQYFSPKSGICHKILDFYEDSFEDSTSIKERLCEVMDKSRLPWSRVTAYGAGNASVNFGVNNSVFQKLKSEENNDVIAVHCNDHILHNCAKNALKVMPVDVENIVMKVFAEFSCSA
ncbi:uncharacterized protein TNCV_2242311 [Trichonephila clavipes]|nr:uncharacterized protein TNCV_2242311 [Trichonephila clavipes]